MAELHTWIFVAGDKLVDGVLRQADPRHQEVPGRRGAQVQVVHEAFHAGLVGRRGNHIRPTDEKPMGTQDMKHNERDTSQRPHLCPYACSTWCGPVVGVSYGLRVGMQKSGTPQWIPLEEVIGFNMIVMSQVYLGCITTYQE